MQAENLQYEVNEVEQPLLGPNPVHSWDGASYDVEKNKLKSVLENLTDSGEKDFDFPVSETRRAWIGTQNLDVFFSQLYTYWEEKGLVAILTSRCLNLTALAFTGIVSGTIMIGIDYNAILNPCLKTGECNLWDIARVENPFSGRFGTFKILVCTYLLGLFLFWSFSIAHLIIEIRSLLEVRRYYERFVGLTDHMLRYASWPEVASRIIDSQRVIQLCRSRDLNESDIAARIMRFDNFFIGLLQNGLLILQPSLLPGLHSQRSLTKILEWNLRFCLFHNLFDDKFRLKDGFTNDSTILSRRFRFAAIINALLAPFLLLFLVTYFFLKNAEEIYHHPSTIAARRWSSLAKWKLREFNELPCFLNHRLNAGYESATKYVQQFPNITLSHIARFVAFIAGSLMAGILLLTVIDEHLLEWELIFGRQTLWWLALLGIVLATSKPAIIDNCLTVFEPDVSLLEVCVLTHYFPKHWRGRGHTLEVLKEFEGMFQYRAYIFLQEFSSIVLTPVLLWFQLPRQAPEIIEFMRETAFHLDGVGDVCYYSAFEATGLPQIGKRQKNESKFHLKEKLENSMISFSAAYPCWKPPMNSKAWAIRGTTSNYINLQKTFGNMRSDLSCDLIPDNRNNITYDLDSMFSIIASQYPGIAGYMRASMPPAGVNEEFDNKRNKNQEHCKLVKSCHQCLGSLFSSAEILPNYRSSGITMEHPGERIAFHHALCQSFHEFSNQADKESMVEECVENTKENPSHNCVHSNSIYERSDCVNTGKSRILPWNRPSTSSSTGRNTMEHTLSSELTPLQSQQYAFSSSL